MMWLVAPIALVSLLAGWTVCYHCAAVLHRWPRGVALGLLILVLGSLPLGTQVVISQRDAVARDREVSRSINLFKAQYPDAQLAQVVKVVDTWLYNYQDGGAPHSVLRIGGNWMPLATGSSNPAIQP